MLHTYSSELVTSDEVVVNRFQVDAVADFVVDAVVVQHQVVVAIDVILSGVFFLTHVTFRQLRPAFSRSSRENFDYI